LVLAGLQAFKDRAKLQYFKHCLEKGQNIAEVIKFMQHDFWTDLTTSSIPFRAIAVEKESEAATLAQNLIAKLGCTDYVSVRNCDGKDFVIPQNCQTVFVASMVGNKEQVMSGMMSKMKHGQEVTFVVRSAKSTSLRSLLYEPIEETMNAMETRIPMFQRVKSFLPHPGSRLRHSIHAYRYVHTVAKEAQVQKSVMPAPLFGMPSMA
jgi:hypothetical protein